MSPGSVDELLVVWIIRIALLAYFIALAEWIIAPQSKRARIPWTIGAVACLTHIALAMHFQHHWSNAAAFTETARQTREIIGVDFGGGIYINYLFAIVWLADALWWWVAPAARASRRKWLTWLLHGFLAFIIFNATVVFKTGPLRWTALAACAALLVIIGVSVYRGRPKLV